jgi:hypothetical protein
MSNVAPKRCQEHDKSKSTCDLIDLGYQSKGQNLSKQLPYLVGESHHGILCIIFMFTALSTGMYAYTV